MEEVIKENGKTADNTVKVGALIKMERRSKEYGRTVR
jgi:hypothetical protein